MSWSQRVRGIWALFKLLDLVLRPSFQPTGIGSSRAGHALSSSCGSMTYSPVRLTLTLYSIAYARGASHTTAASSITRISSITRPGNRTRAFCVRGGMLYR